MQDYYKELGLTPSASDEAIKQAYRALARKYHPDINPSASATARFKVITEAYHVLSDPRRRMAYHQAVLRKPAQATTAPIPPRITQRELLAAFQRIAAYAVTAAAIFGGGEWLVRWLIQPNNPISFALLAPSLLIGLVLGIFWGVDANFVVADFITKPGWLTAFRIARTAAWIGGLWWLGNHLTVLTVETTGLRAVERLHISAVAAGIGALIALVSLWRDH